ncbi:MAG: endolytic transglycosylase MltG [Actinomycetota bacterium]
MLFVALVLVVGGSFGAYQVLSPMIARLTADNDYAGAGSGEVEVVIPTGASGRLIGQTLQKAGVIKTSKAFVEATAQNPKSASVQPGQYVLRKQMSAAAALELLLDPKSRQVIEVTIREGMRVKSTVSLLAKETDTDAADYEVALKEPETFGLPAVAKGKAEGWLFPATYQFDPGTTATDQLAAMVKRAKSELTRLGVSDAKAQRLLIEASIIQVEGGAEKDFPKIAGVIERRLAQNLRLQLDSTVVYGIGKTDIFTTDAQRADTKNLYNTYARDGLPVGPIGNPGRAAMEASLKPQKGDALFFVVVNLDTGETKFSSTYQQHLKYVDQLREWIRKNP